MMDQRMVTACLFSIICVQVVLAGPSDDSCAEDDVVSFLQVGLQVHRSSELESGAAFSQGAEGKGGSFVNVSDFGHEYALASSPDESLKRVFDKIANENIWGSEEDSLSGTGSTIEITARVRECLGQWIPKYNIKLFVDIPCGDAAWQSHIPGLENITYKGYDIADKPVQVARVTNSGHESMSFDQLDLTTDVPREKPDIIMLRDVIQHLPLMKGMQMLLNAKMSGARYLAVTSFTDGKNRNITAGDFYKNNVHAAPFNLPSRLEACQNYADHKTGTTDFLELIDLSAWNR